MEAAQIEIVRVDPSLGERISQRRRTETRALERLRQDLEHGMHPDVGGSGDSGGAYVG